MSKASGGVSQFSNNTNTNKYAKTLIYENNTTIINSINRRLLQKRFGFR